MPRTSSGVTISSGGKDGADLGVEGIEGGGGEWFGLGKLDALGDALLGLDEDEDGDVVRMRARPCADLREAGGEGLAVTAVVEILHVHDLETGLEHDAVGSKGGSAGQAGGGDHLRAGRMRVAAALRICEDIELELAHAAIELRW